MFKKLIAVLFTVVLIAGCGNDKPKKQQGGPQPEKVSMGGAAKYPVIQTKDVDTAGNPVKPGEKLIVMETTKGKMILRFFEKDAPGHVQNFISLADKGFYNGLTFHRVLPGFMAQGGCPLGNGMGNPGYAIKAEFNEKPHLEGTLSMARSNDPNSAGSQFFICFQAVPSLDRQYTVFGQVVEGLDVLHKIQLIDPQRPNPAIKPDKMKKVYIAVKK